MTSTPQRRSSAAIPALRRLVGLLLLTCGLGACAPFADPDSTRSPHARSTFAADLACENCHTTEGWALFGSSGGRGFDHSRTGFPLTGQHAATGCVRCHDGTAEVRRECASCHQDVHQGRLGTGCDSCHSARDFRDVRAIELHRGTQLPLTGMHALADCTQCHQRTTSFTYSAVPSDCVACHERDYLREDIHPLHRGTSTLAPFSRDCASCHTTLGFIPAFVDATGISATSAAGLSARAEHDLRFPIGSGPHRALDCASCHVDAREPRTFQCTGCHAHGLGQLAAQHGGIPTLDGVGCLGCHVGGARR